MFNLDERNELAKASRNTKVVAVVVQYVVFMIAAVVFGLYPTVTVGLITAFVFSLVNYFAALSVYKSDHPLSYDFGAIIMIGGGMVLVDVLLAILTVLFVQFIF